MPKMLRVMKDEPPALAPFLSRLTWRYDPYIIDAIWSRRNREWIVKVNGEVVDAFPSIMGLNAFLRHIGDDLRSGTFTVQAWRDEHVTLAIIEDETIPDNLRLLGAPLA